MATNPGTPTGGPSPLLSAALAVDHLREVETRLSGTQLPRMDREQLEYLRADLEVVRTAVEGLLTAVVAAQPAADAAPDHRSFLTHPWVDAEVA